MSTREVEADIAWREGLKEIQERALLLCAVLPWLQLLVAVCVLEVGESIPANVTSWGYNVVIMSSLNFLNLTICWFSLRKRGTGRHHLVAAVFLALSGLATIAISYWYAYLLVSHKVGIEAICRNRHHVLGRGKFDEPSCLNEWLGITLPLAFFISILAAFNALLAVFAFQIVSAGHKRKIAAIASGLEDKKEYTLW
ncbi:hypothetical protein OIO90_005444 [Microbotryomycetes sp. JL221]|nr:hypothetical protein OIO90_005444 [Microbotryomycetes sp. JL221]